VSKTRGISAADWNLYVNFVAMAIIGDQAGADEIARQHPGPVAAGAAFVRRVKGVQLQKLYRGVLLTPEMAARDMLQPRRSGEEQYDSFTESLDVACWFASASSYMAALVMLQRPTSVGYVVEHEAKKDDVLWHWSWAKAFPFPDRTSTNFAALVCPTIAQHRGQPYADQLSWSLKTQKEVILRPVTVPLKLERVEARAECGGQAGREERLVWRPGRNPARNPIRAHLGRAADLVDVLRPAWPESLDYWHARFLRGEERGEEGIVAAWDLRTPGGDLWLKRPPPRKKTWMGNPSPDERRRRAEREGHAERAHAEAIRAGDLITPIRSVDFSGGGVSAYFFAGQIFQGPAADWTQAVNVDTFPSHGMGHVLFFDPSGDPKPPPPLPGWALNGNSRPLGTPSAGWTVWTFELPVEPGPVPRWADYDVQAALRLAGHLSGALP
jgi:hypothetical protein